MNLTIPLLCTLALALSACSMESTQPAQVVIAPAAPASPAVAESTRPQWWSEQTTLAEPAQRQLQIATRAQEQLAKQLMSKLREGISAGGPAAGIDVCSIEAPAIAKSVGSEHNVRIGRTSHKLRNPDNVGPEWVEPVVADRSASPRYFAGPDGALGVALPIVMGENCSKCHGPVDGIPQEVKDALAHAYPQDMATGFEVGDVRGWFWVEVPRADGSAS